jgi:hypothetical protein
MKANAAALTFLSRQGYIRHNAVYDAVHNASVPRESELRLGGLTIILS